MQTYKILAGKVKLNLKTFFQLSPPRLNSNLSRTAGLLIACGRLAVDWCHHTVSYRGTT